MFSGRGRRASDDAPGWRLAVLVLSRRFLWFLSILLLLVFAKNYYGYAAILLENLGGFLYLFYDWPDIAFFTKVVQDGRFFSDYPEHFINGGAMAGAFPPVFHIIAAAVNLAFNDLENTLTFCSIALSLLSAWLLLKDWPGWGLKIALFLLLFFPPVQPYAFPMVMRMREMLAVLFLVLMFKDAFRLGWFRNLLVGGSLLVLTQPLVALMGIPLFFAVRNGRIDLRLDRKTLLAIIFISLLFLLTYHSHAVNKLQALLSGASAQCGFNAIGCAFTVLTELWSARFFAMFLGFAPLFIAFTPHRDIRLLWLFSLAGYLLLALLGLFPDLVVKLLFLVSQDVCMSVYPLVAFFCLFPPKSQPKTQRMRLLVAWLVFFSLWSAASCRSLGLEWAWPLKTADQAVIASVGSDKTMLNVNLYRMASNEEVYFNNFNFHIMSLAVLEGVPVRMHYSPYNQFYDTANLLPLVRNFIDSGFSRDLAGCLGARAALANRTDYLHINMDISDWGNPEGGGLKAIGSLTDREFLGKCNITLLHPANNTTSAYLLYYFPG